MHCSRPKLMDTVFGVKKEKTKLPYQQDRQNKLKRGKRQKECRAASIRSQGTRRNHWKGTRKGEKNGRK